MNTDASVIVPAEAVPVDADRALMPAVRTGDWAIPNNCGARIVDARMAYGWNECRKEMLENIAAAPAQAAPEGVEGGEVGVLDRVYANLMAAWRGTGRHRGDGTHSADMWDWAQAVFGVRARLATRPSSDGGLALRAAVDLLESDLLPAVEDRQPVEEVIAKARAALSSDGGLTAAEREALERVENSFYETTGSADYDMATVLAAVHRLSGAVSVDGVAELLAASEPFAVDPNPLARGDVFPACPTPVRLSGYRRLIAARQALQAPAP